MDQKISMTIVRLMNNVGYILRFWRVSPTTQTDDEHSLFNSFQTCSQSHYHSLIARRKDLEPEKRL